MKYETLLEAQMGEFSDSIVLTDMEMLEALRTTVPDWLVDHKIEDWSKFEAHYEMGVFTNWYYYEWKQKETEMCRAQWARSAFLYKSQDPQGFFYACGKKPNGTYRYVGYRFGLNDHEYASGFIGMEYIPQQVNRS